MLPKKGFSPNPRELIPLTGEIVWLNKARKLAGLRFTQLTHDSREQIRSWLAETSEAQIQLPPFAIPARKDGKPTRSRGFSETREEAAPASAPAIYKASRADENPAAVLPNRSHPFEPLLDSANRHLREPRFGVSAPQSSYSVWTGFLLFVFLAVAMALSPDLRAEVDRSLRWIANKVTHRADTGSIPALALPGPRLDKSSPNALDVPSSGETPAPGALEKPQADTLQESPVPPEPHSTELPTVSNPFEGGPFDLAPSLIAQRLWDAVSDGDDAAAVALAQLYVRGEGVPQNCDQARILLTTAAKHGNKEAILALKHLRKMGCR
jgi:hypothetical protein